MINPIFKEISTPYDFQIEGAKFALTRKGAIIADEMGLGKTIQAIGVINKLPAFPKVLIICPSVSKYSWLAEIEAWRTYLYTPVVIEAKTGINLKHGEVFIINYDILRWKNIKEILLSQIWDLVICDEFHYLRNSTSQRSKVAYALQTRRRVYLSGTPIPNKVKNLWAPLRSLCSSFGSYRDFTREYCGGHFEGYGRFKEWKADGATNLDKLHMRLKPFMVRRLAKDVLDLPPLTTEIVPVPSSEESRSLAEEIARIGKELLKLKTTGNITKMKALDKMSKNNIAKYRKNAGLQKIEPAIREIKEAIKEHGKVVVFAYHRDVTKAIHKAFKNQSVMVIGGVPSKKKKEAEQQFQNDPNIKVFVGNTESAGVTLTLTAACVEIFVEQDWCPDRILQAMKRCHRIGQTKSVRVKFLVLNDSIDVNMARAVDRKVKHMQTAIDGVDPHWAEMIFQKDKG